MKNRTRILSLLLSLLIIFTFMPSMVFAESTSPGSAQIINLNQSVIGEFDENAGHVTRFYKFRTGSDKSASYSFKAVYTSPNTEASNDGMTFSLLDSNLNPVAWDSDSNTAYFNTSYHYMRLTTGGYGSMTYNSLKPNTDYYVTVETESYHMSYMAYELCVSSSASSSANLSIAQQIKLDKNVIGEFDENAGHVTRFYKFRTGSDKGASYTYKASYTSPNTEASNDGMTFNLLDSNLNPVAWDSDSNTAYFNTSYHYMRLTTGDYGSMTYNSLKPNTDYYVTVETESYHMSYMAYELSVSYSPANVTKAKKVKTVTVNVPTVTAKAIDTAVKKKGGSNKYVTKIILGKKVKKISKNAFKKYKKVKTLEVKTTKLKKASVKGSLKGSKVTAIRVNLGNQELNTKYVKTYKKIFKKKNSGKKVTVTVK